MSQTLEEFRAQMKRELSAAANNDLKSEVQRVQKARGCSFEEAWRRTEREHPDLFRVGATAGRSSEPESPQTYLGVEARAQKLIYASGGTMTMGQALDAARREVVTGSIGKPLTTQDPQIAQEMGKHRRLEDSRQSDAVGDHVDRMAKIRKLMADKNLPFDRAFTLVCEEESAAKTPASAALTTSGGTVKAITPSSDRDKAIEAAGHKGLLYIEGGNCGMFCPLPGTGKIDGESECN